MKSSGKLLWFAAIAYLFTVSSPALAGTPGPSVSLGKSKGLEYLKGTYQQVATQTTQPVACDDGEVTGGGGSIGGSPATSALNESYPVDVNKWHAEASSTAGARTLTGFAICDLDGLIDHFTTQTSLGDDSTLVAFSACIGFPQPIGGGGGASGPGVRLIASVPSLPPSTTGWRPVALNPTVNDTLFDSWAICASPQGVSYRKSDPKKITAGDSGKATAKCKDSEAVLGGGFQNKGNVAGLKLFPSALKPVDSKDSKKVPDDGWRVEALNGETSKISLVAIAVCRKP